MTFKSDTVCAICCEIFSKGHQNNLKHLFHFQNLCSSLSTVTVATVDGAATTANANRNSANGQDKKFDSSCSSEIQEKLGTSICPTCLACVSSILTKRDQLISLEEKVRQLQTTILHLLNNLQGGGKTFKAGVVQMEAIVERSRDNVRNLDDFYCSGTMEDENQERDLLKDVIQFREKVLTVFDGLRTFSNNLQVFPNPTIPSTNSHYSTEVINNDTSHGDLMGKGKSSRARKRVPVVCEEEEENDGDFDDNYSHDFKVEGGDVDEECTTDSWGNNDNFRDASPLNPSSATLTRENSDSESTSDDEDEEEEFLPSRNFLNTKGEKTKRNRVRDPSTNAATDNGSLLETIDVSNMSTFKKNLISRIIKRRERQQKIKTNNNSKSNKRKRRQCKTKTPEELLFDEIDPKNFCFFNYDPSKSNTLSLRDVDITIDEQQESLECTKCDFKCYQSKTKYPFEFEGAMYNHVVARHLKLYVCPHCPRDSFANMRRFRFHLLSHTNRYACDICGKPLADEFSLKQHKWHHLSEQEKAEAVKNGMKPPGPWGETYRKRDTMEKNYVCSTCGKGFRYPSDLKYHEVVHSSNRPDMCSQCGQTFKGRKGLSNHLKYACKGKPPTQLTLFHCAQCPTTFRSLSKLKGHKKDVHTSELLYKCSVCGKMLKTKASVRLHERTHSDTRPFLCGKGCGATYKDKANLSRHEKKCGNG